MNVVSRGIRNAFRNGIRTFSIVIILGLSIGLVLTMVVAHQAVQSRIAAVKGSIGNQVTIAPAGVRGFEGGGNPLTGTQLAAVASLPHVSSLTQTLGDRLDSTQTNLQSAITAGSLGRRNGDVGGGGFGGQGAGGGAGGGSFTPPVMVTGSNNLNGSILTGGGNPKLTSGKTFDPSVDANVALVGSSLASKNSLSVGSTFQAYGETFTVDGIYDAGNTFSNSGLVMPLKTVQRLSQQPDDVTNAVATVDSIANVPAAVSDIKGKLGSTADVVSAQDMSNQALAPLESIATISTISVIGALIAGAAIILLTMMMIVRERRREIGVLKAIGSSNVKVTLQFMSEAITFTLLGAVVGLVLGVIGANPVTRLLATSTTTSGGASSGPGGFGRAGGALLRAGGESLRNLNADVGWTLVLYGLGAALIIAIIGSALPAWVIAKVRPAEVMRAE